jgi:hypothetical protein
MTDAKEDRSGLSAAARRTPYPLDRAAYKRRNVVKRMFCKLKNWRRVATRYDRVAGNYLRALHKGVSCWDDGGELGDEGFVERARECLAVLAGDPWFSGALGRVGSSSLPKHEPPASCSSPWR